MYKLNEKEVVMVAGGAAQNQTQPYVDVNGESDGKQGCINCKVGAIFPAGPDKTGDAHAGVSVDNAGVTVFGNVEVNRNDGAGSYYGGVSVRNGRPVVRAGVKVFFN